MMSLRHWSNFTKGPDGTKPSKHSSGVMIHTLKMKGKILSMREVSAMASDMVRCLRFTWDCPSLYEDNRMPVLDTTMLVAIPKESGESRKLLLGIEPFRRD